MDLYYKEIKRNYLAIKEFEWSHDRLSLLESLTGLNWATDRLYLFCKLRLYARFLDYRKLFHQQEIGLCEEDFSALQVLAKQQRPNIKLEDPLWAYFRTTEILNMSPKAANTPSFLDDHLSYLESKVTDLEQEDFVDCVNYLLNYALQAVNRGNNRYDQPLFRAVVLIINRKYGEGWKPSKHVRLNDKIFSLTVTSALALEKRRNWRESLIYGIVPTSSGSFTVYDWVHQFLKVYSSRLKKDVRKATLDYCKLRIAFHEESYEDVAIYLDKLKDEDLKFYGRVRRIITLIAHYELRYRHGKRAHPAIRKFAFDVKGTLTALRMNYRDLEQRQQRLPVHVEHIKYFVEGYENLLDIRETIAPHQVGSQKRRQVLEARCTTALNTLEDFKHRYGDWLRTCLHELR